MIHHMVSRLALGVKHWKTDLVLRALCVEHGEQHVSIAVAFRFVCLQNFAESGWRGLVAKLSGYMRAAGARILAWSMMRSEDVRRAFMPGSIGW